MSLPRTVLLHRDRACDDCRTPCGLRSAHDDPCDKCPLTPPAFDVWNCDPSAPRVGDRVAAVAQPVARTIDKATRGATHVAKCGNCKSTQADLNHGRRSDDPRRPVI